MSIEENPRRQLTTLLVIVFLGFVGLSMPYLIFPVLFLNPAYSIVPEAWGSTGTAIALGVTLAAYPLGQFVGSPILGALSDDYGRKKLLALSLLVAAAANLLSAYSLEWRNLGLLIFSRGVAGLMEGNLAIARAMATDLKTISKHETFGKINSVASIAYLVGPLLGGILSDADLDSKFSLATPFYVISVFFVLLSGLTAFALVERPRSPTTSKGVRERLNVLGRLSVLFGNKYLKFLLIVSTLQTLAVDIFYEFGSVYLTAKWMLSPAQLVLFNSLVCISLAIGSGWMLRALSKRFSSQKVMVWSTASMALLLVGIVLSNDWTSMLALFALIGISIALCTTLLTILISDSVDDDIQGEVMGVQISLRVLGDAVICLLGGVLLLISPKVILLVAAALSLVSTLYYVQGQRKV
ncbi:MAG: MFS transporter [Chlamydiales bacterium]|nr:MFS transporter [Chlamydiales bacterium]